MTDFYEDIFIVGLKDRISYYQIISLFLTLNQKLDF